jgi:hypothetical protein
LKASLLNRTIGKHSIDDAPSHDSASTVFSAYFLPESETYFEMMRCFGIGTKRSIKGKTKDEERGITNTSKRWKPDSGEGGKMRDGRQNEEREKERRNDKLDEAFKRNKEEEKMRDEG